MRVLFWVLWVAQVAYSQGRFAFINVTVIDPQARLLLPAMTVQIEGSTIAGVSATKLTPLPGGTRRIDASGKFLMPGLWDAHVHLTKTGAHSLAVFVANGVTSVRDMGSDPAEVSRWRDEIRKGKRIGPRIKMAGPILESAANVARMKREGTVEPVDRIRLPVANPEEAREAVQRIAKLGADHIKMRTTPDPQTFHAAVQEAKKLRLPFTAHVLGAPEAFIDSGVRSVEHALFLPPLAVPTSERRALFNKMVAADLWMSTTLVNIEGSILVPYERGKELVDDRQGRLDPRRKYVGGYLVADWREQVEENRQRPMEEIRRMLPGFYRDLWEMRETGVAFLAGTDAAVAFMYPGFSLHDELAIYVNQLGFSPMEALRVATANPTEFYHMQNELGGMRAGRIADLVLLDANPLEAIANTRQVRGVVLAGRWLDRKQLDRLLASAARQAQRLREPTH